MIFDESPWTVEKAWRKIFYERDEFLAVLGDDLGESDCWLSDRWQPPQQGSIKLNVDGNYRDQDGCMGVGGLIQNDRGQWTFGLFANRHAGNALTVEAQTFLLGLDLVWDQGHRNIAVEVDYDEQLQSIEDEESQRFLPILSAIKNQITYSSLYLSSLHIVSLLNGIFKINSIFINRYILL